MLFSRFLRNRKGSGPGVRGQAHKDIRKRAIFRPRIEALEDRWLPSTLTVLNNLNSGAGSLRAEIAAAASGDTIVFDKSLVGQTITLAGELSVNKSLDIEGLGASNLTVSGANASRVFDIQGGTTVTIAGLTIADGRVVDDKGGGIANEAGATLHLLKDVVTHNTAYAVGGGLWNAIGATVAISNSTFDGNKALGSLTFSYPAEGFSPGGGTAEGGAIDSFGEENVVEISHSVFASNKALGGNGGTAADPSARRASARPAAQLSLSRQPHRIPRQALQG